MGRAAKSYKRRFLEGKSSPLNALSRAIWNCPGGFTPYLVWFVINDGQSGPNKMFATSRFGPNVFTEYEDAWEYCKEVRKTDPYAVVRCGILVEGPTVTESLEGKGKEA